MLSTGIASIVPVREYLDQRGRIAELERQAAGLREENHGLRAQMERLRDPVYLERLARECLGMVMPGEIAFVTVHEEGTGSASVC
jgi:cell division protein FtsB